MKTGIMTRITATIVVIGFIITQTGLGTAFALRPQERVEARGTGVGEDPILAELSQAANNLTAPVKAVVADTAAQATGKGWKIATAAAVIGGMTLGGVQQARINDLTAANEAAGQKITTTTQALQDTRVELVEANKTIKRYEDAQDKEFLAQQAAEQAAVEKELAAQEKAFKLLQAQVHKQIGQFSITFNKAGEIADISLPAVLVPHKDSLYITVVVRNNTYVDSTGAENYNRRDYVVSERSIESAKGYAGTFTTGKDRQDSSVVTIMLTNEAYPSIPELFNVTAVIPGIYCDNTPGGDGNLTKPIVIRGKTPTTAVVAVAKAAGAGGLTKIYEEAGNMAQSVQAFFEVGHGATLENIKALVMQEITNYVDSVDSIAADTASQLPNDVTIKVYDMAQSVQAFFEVGHGATLENIKALVMQEITNYVEFVDGVVKEAATPAAESFIGTDELYKRLVTALKGYYELRVYEDRNLPDFFLSWSAYIRDNRASLSFKYDRSKQSIIIKESVMKDDEASLGFTWRDIKMTLGPSGKVTVNLDDSGKEKKEGPVLLLKKGESFLGILVDLDKSFFDVGNYFRRIKPNYVKIVVGDEVVNRYNGKLLLPPYLISRVEADTLLNKNANVRFISATTPAAGAATTGRKEQALGNKAGSQSIASSAGVDAQATGLTFDQQIKKVREFLTENGLSETHLVIDKSNKRFSLDLYNTQVSDISALSGLTNLEELYLSYTNVSDISALSGLTNLEVLGLSNTQVSDISALSGLTNLKELDLSYTNVSDISALSGLTNLKELDLYNTQVSDISALSGLTNLKELDLSYTNVLVNNIYKVFPEDFTGGLHVTLPTGTEVNCRIISAPAPAAGAAIERRNIQPVNAKEVTGVDIIGGLAESLGGSSELAEARALFHTNVTADENNAVWAYSPEAVLGDNLNTGLEFVTTRRIEANPSATFVIDIQGKNLDKFRQLGVPQGNIITANNITEAVDIIAERVGADINLVMTEWERDNLEGNIARDGLTTVLINLQQLYTQLFDISGQMGINIIDLDNVRISLDRAYILIGGSV